MVGVLCRRTVWSEGRRASGPPIRIVGAEEVVEPLEAAVNSTAFLWFALLLGPIAVVTIAGVLQRLCGLLSELVMLLCIGWCSDTLL